MPLRPPWSICDVGRATGGEEQPQPLGQQLHQQQLAGRVGAWQPPPQLQGPLHPRTLQRRDRQLAQPGRHPEQIFRPAAGERLAQRLAPKPRPRGPPPRPRPPPRRAAPPRVAPPPPPPGAGPPPPPPL